MTENQTDTIPPKKLERVKTLNKIGRLARFLDENEEIKEDALEKAKKAGLEEKCADDFTDAFAYAISGERPYIEHNHDKTITQIYGEVLAAYLRQKIEA
jgi:hypothetical protein